MSLGRILSKYKNYFLGIAIVLSSIAISIRSRDGKVNLILQNYPIIIFMMIMISLFLIVLYGNNIRTIYRTKHSKNTR